MSFVRRKRGQVLLVHNERVAGTARIRREPHRFSSQAELEEALTPLGWTRWTRAIAWRESEIDFDWSSIRERLTKELAAWSAAPSGAKHRRDQKIERLASELELELAQISLAKSSDVAVMERIRPSLTYSTGFRNRPTRFSMRAWSIGGMEIDAVHSSSFERR